MKPPRWLHRLGEKCRAPARIYWNLSMAAMGASVGKFLDRKATSPARKRRWRIALSAVLLVNAAVLLLPLAGLWALLAVLVPLFLGFTYIYGHLVEIWRD